MGWLEDAVKQKTADDQERRRDVASRQSRHRRYLEEFVPFYESFYRDFRNRLSAYTQLNVIEGRGELSGPLDVRLWSDRRLTFEDIAKAPPEAVCSASGAEILLLEGRSRRVSIKAQRCCGDRLQTVRRRNVLLRKVIGAGDPFEACRSAENERLLILERPDYDELKKHAYNSDDCVTTKCRHIRFVFSDLPDRVLDVLVQYAVTGKVGSGIEAEDWPGSSLAVFT